MPHLLLNRLDSRIAQSMCFVLMPFRSDFKNVYTLINNVARECGLFCLRADDILKSSQIMRDIWEKINEARFVIADLSGCNPNVFYELGLAHGIQKTVILIAQEPNKDVPFDISGIRYIQYSREHLRQFRTKLKEAIKVTIPTIPRDLNLSSHESENIIGPKVVLTCIEVPSATKAGEWVEITLKAKNIGHETQEGYFSISFPFGVDGVEIIDSSLNTQKGIKGDKWSNGGLILSYPIAEGFKYEETWANGKEYYFKVKILPIKRGIIWFYVNASCFSTERKWITYPEKPLIDIDQRREPVFCGIIEAI